MLNNVGSENYSFEKSLEILEYMKYSANKIADESRHKKSIYTVVHYSLTLPIILISTSAPVISNLVKDSVPEYDSISSMIVAALTAVMVLIKPDGKRVKYENNYKRCKLFTLMVENYESLEMDQATLKMVVDELNSEYKTLLGSLPSDGSSIK